MVDLNVRCWRRRLGPLVVAALVIAAGLFVYSFLARCGDMDNYKIYFIDGSELL